MAVVLANDILCDASSKIKVFALLSGDCVTHMENEAKEFRMGKMFLLDICVGA
jgi:hypothetical protein